MPETPKLVSGRLNTEDGMVESVEGGTQTHQRGRRTLSGRRVFARPKTCQKKEKNEKEKKKKKVRKSRRREKERERRKENNELFWPCDASDQGKYWHKILIRLCKETFKNTQNSSFDARPPVS